ncbi:Alcohol dehydrogenase patD like protein [Verticillium longisporum]|uniref:Alcohol dehydrogenase patD like protein n=1 Tax=Verticillium longisporum TaxID=100787 RepID=A0A8I2ZP61_VERLO|nr:Alcohol dehydrogenase patD like protein [Verticillium longisporum]
MSSLPKTYKAWVVEKAGGPMVLKDLELKQPGPNQVLVRVRACGVCHSDTGMSSGAFGDVFPRVPGHELVGDVVAVGEGVTRFSGGERVGGPWHGGHDLACRQCQRGQFQMCDHAAINGVTQDGGYAEYALRGQFQMCDHAAINGVTQDGGYAEYALLRSEAVVRIPKELDVAEVAPLLCAGVTVFNSIRKMQIEQGNLVAVQGVGGLGHLAVQYAVKMGYKVVVLSSGSAKEDFARKLGAHEYIDSSKDDPVKKLQELGGAALIPAGKLCILAPVGGLEINSIDLIVGGRSVWGWPAGHALDSEEAIAFASTHNVKCMIEKFPMSQAKEATDHMLQNKVRFRSVLMIDE